MMRTLTARLLRRARALGRDESGESMISIALSLTVMFAFTFGIMEVGLAMYSREMISEMAREGMRYASLHGSTCKTSPGGASCTLTAAQIKTYIQGLNYPNLAGGTINVGTPTFPDTTQNVGNRVSVTITYTLPYNIPFMFNKNITLTSSSTMYYLL